MPVLPCGTEGATRRPAHAWLSPDRRVAAGVRAAL